MKTAVHALGCLCALLSGICSGLYAQFSPVDGFEISDRQRARAAASEAPGRLPDLPPKPPVAQESEVQPLPPIDAETLPKPKGEDLRFAEAPLYHVAGFDYASVQSVFQLGKEAVRTLEPFVVMPENPPLPLLIQLVPLSDENRDGLPYWMNMGAMNNVIVSVRWSEETLLSDVCEAFAFGLLYQSFLSQYGPTRTGEIPRWLVVGLGVNVYVRLQSVRIDGVQEASEQSQALPLTVLFGGESADKSRFSNDAFWLLRTIQLHSPDRMVLQRRIARFATESDAFLVLRENIPPAGPTPAQAQLWWTLERQQRIDETPPRVWSIARSREFMAQQVLIPASIAGQDKLLNVPELWPYRGTAQAKVAALDRMRLMRTQTNKINPLYFNAAVSYSEALESLLQNNEAQMRKKYDQFLADLAQALALEQAIEAALNAPLFSSPPSQATQGSAP